MKHKQKL